jgi:hypothetical protein
MMRKGLPCCRVVGLEGHNLDMMCKLCMLACEAASLICRCSPQTHAVAVVRWSPHCSTSAAAAGHHAMHCSCRYAAALRALFWRTLLKADTCA